MWFVLSILLCDQFIILTGTEELIYLFNQNIPAEIQISPNFLL